MSKRKNRERAEHFVYRQGRRIPRADWDKYQRELKEAEEWKRLKALGLIRNKPNILIAERMGLEKAPKQIMTPAEIWNERKPIRRK